MDKKYEADEARVVGWMSGESSRSCEVFQGLRVDRSIIREALKRLRHSRIQQATLCSILCATRFKFFSPEGLHPKMCGRCSQTDSFQNVIQCTGMGTAPTDPDALAGYLAELADRACVGNPNLPIPITAADDTEINLEVDLGDGTAEIGLGEIQTEEIGAMGDDEVAFDAAALLALGDADV